MKDRDLSITKLRDDAHTDVRNIRKDRKSRLLDKHRRIQVEDIVDVMHDQNLDSIFELVWGFSKLTCFTKVNGNQPETINVNKRKASPVDLISYYDIPESKMMKLL